jgi:hypothetical protein
MINPSHTRRPRAPALSPCPGVETLANGSTIVASYVTFTNDTPPAMVSAATEQLQASAQDLFKQSSEWPPWEGGLVRARNLLTTLS